MKKKIKFNRILLICFILYIAYILLSRNQVLRSYKQEEKKYQNLIAEEQQKNAELLQEKENLDSTEYIEEIARDKLGMYLPNERVYIDISK